MKKTFLLFMIVLMTGCVARKSPQKEIESRLKQADAYKTSGEYRSAEIMAEEAIRWAKRTYGEDSIEAADIYAKSISYAYDIDTIQEWAGEAEDIYKVHKDFEGLATTYYFLGKAYYTENNREEAEKALEKALKYCDDQDSNAEEIRYDIFLLKGMESKDWKEALINIKKAEEEMLRMPEELQKEKKIKLYNYLGNCYYGLDSFEDAIYYYDKAIGEEWKNEDDRIIIIRCYDYRGNSYKLLGSYEKAKEDLIYAQKEMESIVGKKLWDLALVNYHLASVYVLDEPKDYVKALEYGIQACRVYTQQNELSSQELKELKSFKEHVENMYEMSPYAGQEEFEFWYQKETIK